MRKHLSALFLSVPALLLGCEVLVDFDRTRINDSVNDASVFDQTINDTGIDAATDDATDANSSEDASDADLASDGDGAPPEDTGPDAPANNLPFFAADGGAPSATPATINEGATTNLKSLGIDLDVGDTVTYTWTQVSPGGPVGSFSPNTTTASPSWTAPRVTSNTAFTLRCTIGDGKGTAQANVIVNVTDNINDAPVLTGPTAASPVVVGTDVNLTASATDADGDTISFAWSETSGPNAGAFTNANSKNAVWRAPVVTAATVFTLRVSVSDGKAAAVTGNVNVTVNPPTFAADIQPIFTNNCIGCHDNNHSTGLDLRTGNSYALLVGVNAALPGDCSGAVTKRVVASNADDSILWKRISGTTCTNQMPLGGPPLPLGLQDRIRAWILAGGLNN